MRALTSLQLVLRFSLPPSLPRHCHYLAYPARAWSFHMHAYIALHSSPFVPRKIDAPSFLLLPAPVDRSLPVRPSLMTAIILSFSFLPCFPFSIPLCVLNEHSRTIGPGNLHQCPHCKCIVCNSAHLTQAHPNKSSHGNLHHRE